MKDTSDRTSLMNYRIRNPWRAGLAFWPAFVLAATLGWAAENKPAPRKATYLGVAVEPVSETLQHQLRLPRGAGLSVVEVIAGSPAEQGGLKPHDVIERLDDQLLFNPAQLRALVRSLEPGQTAKIRLWHEGEARSVEVKLGETEVKEPEGGGTIQFAPDGRRLVIGEPGRSLNIWRIDPQTKGSEGWQRFAPAIREARPGGASRGAKPSAYLGVQLKPVDPSLAAQLGLEAGDAALLGEVLEGSPAAAAGLQEHDLVLRFEDEAVKGPDALAKAIRRHKKGDVVTLQILRGGKKTEVKATLDERVLPEPEEVERLFERIEKKIQGNPGSGRVEQEIILHESPVRKDTQSHTSSESSVMVIQSDDGVVTVQRTNGRRTARVEDPKGKVLFDGPIDTEEERQRLPQDLRKRVDRLLDAPPQPNPPAEIERLELQPGPPPERETI